MLKPNVAHILLFHFCEQKFIQHGPITIAIYCNGHSLLIFEEKWLKYASGLKSARNSESFWVRRLFNVCVRVFCAPNATILFIYIPDKIKWASSEKMIFFLPKSSSSVSRSQTIYPSVIRSAEGKTNYLSYHIRHELGVTVHEISTSWKKMLDGEPNTSVFFSFETTVTK